MTEWLKLDAHIFDNRKVKKALKGKDGYKACTVYIMLLCHARIINSDGRFEEDDKTPIKPKTLANELNVDIRILSRALKTLVETGLVKSDRNGVLFIPNWSFHQNSEELRRIKDRERKSRQRALDISERQDENDESDGGNSVQKCPQKNADKTDVCPHTETDRDIEKEKEEDIFLSDDRKIGGRSDIDREKRELFDIGPLGHGYVTMTNEQMNDLLERMPVDMFDDYVSRLGEFLKKKNRRSNTCYKTILSWYENDTRIDGP